MTLTMPIDQITVEDRHRRDLGDVAALAESINESGLLNPVAVTESGRLVAGQRRLEAHRILGRDEIAVNVIGDLVDARQLLVAERDENTCRLEMKPSEKVALGLALEELERPAAAERKGHGQTAPGKPKNAEENFSQASQGERTGKVYDLVGESVGMSGPTYKRAKRVVLEASAENPVAEAALAEMDRTGKVAAAYKKVAATIPEAQEARRFRVTSDRDRVRAEKARTRIEKAVGACNGLARGLADLDPIKAVAVTSSEDIAGWNAAFIEATAAIKRLRSRLKEVS